MTMVQHPDPDPSITFPSESARDPCLSLAVPTADTAAIVKEALARPLEALARATLRG